MKLKELAKLNLVNALGWRTNRKIVVFESDDWGSIRMPSRKTFDDCLRAGYPVDKNPYERFDALESEDDLSALFETLLAHKDAHGNPPVITANSLVANPDFERIEKSGFAEYHYELVTNTFKTYPQHKNCFQLWIEGAGLKVFRLQLHGREHLNVSHFMNDLRAGKEQAIFAFQNKMPGSILKSGLGGNKYVLATNYSDEIDKISKFNILIEAAHLFRKLHNFTSSSFIATNYTWSPDFNLGLSEAGVKYLQGNVVQKVPKVEKPGFDKLYHYTGQKNKQGQYYLVRNCVFEPSLTPNINSVDFCLKQISNAFFWQKPAIISSHRLNFIGFIDETNRMKNLRSLHELLRRIIKKWPDVEFMSSDQLGALIEKK